MRALVALFVLLIGNNLFGDGRGTDIAYWVEAGPTASYAVGIDGGFFSSTDGGASWEDRSSGLPVRVVYPFTGKEHRRITSASSNPLSPEYVAVTTAYGAYLSEDGGAEWKSIPLSAPLKPVDHISAVAISPHSRDLIFIGTSFNGLAVSRDGGATWESSNASIKQLYKGAGFYEEISAMAISPADPDRVYLAAGFGGGIYVSTDGGAEWHDLGFPGAVSAGEIEAIGHTSADDNDGWILTVRGERELWDYSEALGWRRSAGPGASDREEQAIAIDRMAGENPPVSSIDMMRRRISTGRTGIYINSAWASGERLASHFALLKAQGMNSVVVDMKDDTGRLRYDSLLPLPAEVGATWERFDLGDLLPAAHENGIYVIGRVVVFQDPKLYRFRDSSYAIWDDTKDTPWGNLIRVSGGEGEESRLEQREFWVDPYSEFVWRYNIAIARELEERGVDEIQFDYIRFPSDGDLSTTHYRYRRDGMTKVDAIESFLRLAREEISIPISTDLYGFNSWYRMGNWIGQNIDVIADYVDAICPMFYPSHFPGSFLRNLTYFDRAYAIYENGGQRAVEIVQDRAVIRPYVQAFLIGSERSFEKPEFTSYLYRQLEGNLAAGASGFTLWNASNIYYMVTEDLTRFTAGRALSLTQGYNRAQASEDRR